MDLAEATRFNKMFHNNNTEAIRNSTIPKQIIQRIVVRGRKRISNVTLSGTETQTNAKHSRNPFKVELSEISTDTPDEPGNSSIEKNDNAIFSEGTLPPADLIERSTSSSVKSEIKAFEVDEYGNYNEIDTNSARINFNGRIEIKLN